MLGKRTTFISGKLISSEYLNRLIECVEYDTYASLLAATIAEAWDNTATYRGRWSFVKDSVTYYIWNGTALKAIPVAGGTGAPTTASYITLNAEDGLESETRHIDLTRANAHPPPLHAADHQNGGEDEINVVGLSGKLADEQNAGWIKNHLCMDTLWAAGKVLAFDITGNIVPLSLPGGGDMAKATYDTDDDGKVESAENSDALGGTAASSYALNTALRTQLKSDGANPFLVTDLLNCRARVGVFKGGVLVTAPVRNIDFIEGTDITITPVYNVETDTVQLTFASTGGGGVGGFGQEGTDWYVNKVTGATPITVTHNLNSTNVAVIATVNQVQPYSIAYEIVNANTVKIHHGSMVSQTVSVMVKKLS